MPNENFDPEKSKKYFKYNKAIEDVYYQNNFETNCNFIARVIIKQYSNALIKQNSFRKYITKYLKLNGLDGKSVDDFKRLQEEATQAGLNVNDVKHAWIKDEGVSLFVKNPLFGDASELIKVEIMFDEIILKYKDSFTPIKIRPKQLTDLNLCYCNLTEF